MHRLPLLLCFLISGVIAAQTQTSDDAAGGDESAAVQLETILVTGEQPGPGLWKVSRGENVLWILGTVSPLPKKMVWLSPSTEAVIAASQEIIQPPSITAKVGWFTALTMLPTLLGARKNPEAAKLRDVLPAELYARWQAQKARYLGKDDDSEKWRPMFAGGELFDRALKQSGLSGQGVVWPVVAKLAKRQRIPITATKYMIEIEKARKTMKHFRKSELDDLACFERLLGRVENDLPAMAARANAWAVGDLAALRELDYRDQKTPCLDAWMQSSVVTDQKLDDLLERVDARWFAAVEQAISKHRQSFAVLSIDELIKPDGYGARLAVLGYQVESPEQREQAALSALEAIDDPQK